MAGKRPSAGVRCERARHSVSLRLDRELSALEEQALERHLAACEACRAFEAGVRSATELLRAAPPEIPGLRHRLPRRSDRLTLQRRQTALVAAAALALGALVGSLLERPSARQPEPAGPQVSLLARDVQQLRELPRVEKRNSPAPVRSGPPNPPEGVI
jgi:hypothetical protein